MSVIAETIQEFSDTSQSGTIGLDSLSSVIKNINIINRGFIKNASIFLNGTNQTKQFLDLMENSGSAVANQGYLAQSFNQTRTTNINILSFFVSRSGNPIVNVTLREGDDLSPSNLILGNTTLTSVEVPSSRAWINITLSSTTTLNAGTRYWIVMNDTLNNEFNIINWFHTSEDYANGTSIGKPNIPSTDLSFKYYGNSSNYPTNLTININGTKVYENLSNTSYNFNDSTKINLSASAINDLCNKNICVIGINFTSFSDSAIIYSNINITQNEIPNTTNVSITPLPLNEGIDAKGHANYSDADGDSAGGNQTYWYVNKTIVNEANNSFTLLSGNVTANSNITFSARFNDTYDWSDWVNSSTITVGDSTPPVIFGNSTQGKTSFTTNDIVNITVNVTDTTGTIDLVRTIINRTGTSEITNNTMIKLDGNLYQYATTYAVDTFDIVSFYARDGSQNVNIVESTLSFTVTSPSGGEAGGGGGTSIITRIENQNQTSLFFGFTTFSFFVISTPSEQVKLIKFKNIGNATFMDADVKVLGNANRFISAEVCNINQTEICETENINILAGENKFLRLDANFTSELGMGSEGIIRLESLTNSQQEGKIVDLLLSIDRPPAYRLLIEPISNSSPYRQFIGDNELPALIAGYGLFVSAFAFGISITKGML